MQESIKKAFANFRKKPYFNVVMNQQPDGSMTVKADWNEHFIEELEKLGYDNIADDDDKVDAYIRACYFESARKEGIEYVDGLEPEEED